MSNSYSSCCLLPRSQAGAWDWLLQDGLGSVRAVVDEMLAVQERRMYAPYGEPYDGVGTSQTVYGFTGEPTDADALVYLRARYLNPGLGVFASRDPWEGVTRRPMSVNGYSWVEGNAPNKVDSSGMCLSFNVIPQTSGNCLDILSQWLSEPDFIRSLELYDAYVECRNRNLATPTPTLTPMPTPTPTPTPAAVIFFAGSDIRDPSLLGPGSTIQTPIWIDPAYVPGLTEVVEYLGSGGGVTAKVRQVNSVEGNYSQSNIIVIGYSGGADSAVMWAYQYATNPQNTGKVTDLVILGGTMDATSITGGQLRGEWQDMLEQLLSGGTDVYILDDAALADPNWSSLGCQSNQWLGNCTYVSSNRVHYEEPLPGNAPSGTNNDPNLVNEIFAWINQF